MKGKIDLSRAPTERLLDGLDCFQSRIRFHNIRPVDLPGGEESSRIVQSYVCLAQSLLRVTSPVDGPMFGLADGLAAIDELHRRMTAAVLAPPENTYRALPPTVRAALIPALESMRVVARAALAAEGRP